MENKKNTFTLVSGLTLIIIGAVTMAGNYYLGTKAWKLWPMIIVLAGIGLTVPGFFGFSRTGFGSFFIPGLPVLTTGGILLYTSVTGNWDFWAVAWVFEVIALALGFAMASIFMRVGGLAVPASIVGVNGLIFAFCAFTGLWKAWAILWPAEILSVGIGLLILGIVNRQAETRQAASILFSIAGAGFFLTSFFSSLNNISTLKYVVPVMLTTTGLLLIGTFLIKDNGPDETKIATTAEPVSVKK